MAGSEVPVSLFLVPSEVTSGEYLTVRSIQFGFDSFELTKDAQITLEKVYGIMQTYPSLLVEISGHTDSKGSPAYNKVLSLKRAKSAVDFLINKGITSTRFVTRAAGADENIAIDKNPDGTDNPDGRRFNRRASIKVIKGNASVIINEDVSIPENLKAQREEYYTILLCKQKAEADTSWFKSLPLLKNNGVILSPVADGYLITTGHFGKKGDALKLLGQFIDGGFPAATILSNVEVNQLMPTKTDTLVITLPEQKQVDAKFWIQIMASKQPTELVKFGDLTNMGSPNAASIVDLLSAIHPEALLFLGKCGGLKKKNSLGDLILPIAAIRSDGTSSDYLPPEIPALPAFNMHPTSFRF